MRVIPIRKAVKNDLGIINDIFNYYVVHSTCTYRTEPATPIERSRWFEEHNEPYFVTVAEVDGRIIGWASISRFRTRAAYEKTVEDSIYVHNEWLHRGIGKTLLEDLIERAKTAGFHTIIASISDDQIPSIKLHEKFGFELAGRIKEVGNKFGRWLDVAYMQLML